MPKKQKKDRRAVRKVEDRTFAPFPRIPPEIRIKIWKQALPGPRTITVVPHLELSAAERRTPIAFRLDDEPTPVKTTTSPIATPLLHVCKESRHEALKVYQVAFQERFMGMGGFYFDFSRDTLYLMEDTLDQFCDGPYIPRDLSKLSADVIEWQENIRFLILGGPCFSTKNLVYIYKMHSLKTLTLEIPLGRVNNGFWGTLPHPVVTPDIEMADAGRDLKRYWKSVLKTDDETKYPVTVFLSKKELAQKRKEDVSLSRYNHTSGLLANLI